MNQGNPHRIFGRLVPLLIAISGGFSWEVTADEARPNFLIILADDK